MARGIDPGPGTARSQSVDNDKVSEGSRSESDLKSYFPVQLQSGRVVCVYMDEQLLHPCQETRRKISHAAHYSSDLHQRWVLSLSSAPEETAMSAAK